MKSCTTDKIGPLNGEQLSYLCSAQFLIFSIYDGNLSKSVVIDTFHVESRYGKYFPEKQKTNLFLIGITDLSV